MSYVFVHEVRDLAEARVVISFLEAHGVTARIRDEKMRETAPHLEYLMGKLLIEVPESQAIEASQCLEEMLRRREALLAKNPTGEQKEYEELLAASQNTARSAFISAVLGTFLIPLLLNFYSLKLGFRVMKTESPVSPKSWRYLLAAGVFNMLSFWFWFNNFDLLKKLFHSIF